ncbi:MAG: DUF4340 domain-containing protein [bacterium]
MKKRLLLLVIAALVLGSGAWLANNRSTARVRASVVGSKVLPALPLDQIARIVIRAPGGTNITLSRLNEQWVVAERANYPADFAKLREVVQKLTDLKIREVVRINPDQLASLALLPPDTRDSTGTTGRVASEVALQNATGKTLATLRLGKSRMRRGDSAAMGGMDFGGYSDGRYIARTDSEVMLVADSLEDLTSPLASWLDPTFIDIPTDQISQIEVTGPGRAAVALTRQTGGGFALPNVSTNKEPDEYKIGRIPGALTGLRFSDLAPTNLPAAVSGLDHPVILTAHCADGRTVTIQLGATVTNASERYATVAIAYTPPPEMPPSGGTNAAALAEAKTKAVTDRAARDKTASDVRALQARLAPWCFLLSAYSADAMLTSAAELVKDITVTSTNTSAAVKGEQTQE